MSKDLTKTIDERVAEMEPVQKDLYIRIMFLMSQFPEYAEFVEKHFDIKTKVHHDTKEIDVIVIQKPVEVEDANVGALQISVEKSLQAQLYLKGKGVQDAATILTDLYEILGGSVEVPLIVSASSGDIAGAVKASGKIIT